MRVIGLPGRHPYNGPWLAQVLAGLNLPDAVIENHAYQCWDSPGTDVDEDAEIQRVAAFEPQLIVAKSLGTIVSSLGIHRKALHPSLLVLIGIPLGALAEEEVAWYKALARQGITVLTVQQTHDPGGSFQEIHALLASERHTVVEVPGDDHLYQDVPLLVDKINTWLGSVLGASGPG